MRETLIPAVGSKEVALEAYVPQIEDREKVEEWLAQEWTWERRMLPESNWCAMCCVRSIALCLDLEPPSLDELYERALRAWVYDYVKEFVVGAVHEALARFIGEEFPLFAKAARALTKGDVIGHLNEGCFVIASVSPQIRHLSGEPPVVPKGHLVLVYGTYAEDEGEGGVILHNSTGLFSTNTQAHVPTPWKRFLECFSGNAIIVKS